MRLTNVAHLRLPFGRLLGYDLTVGPQQGAVPVSFDQRRHVARGHRPGSWMAITVRLASVDLDALADAWLAVVARHGTLRTVFSPGPDGPRLHDHAMSAGSWVEHRVETGESVNEALRSVLDAFCGSTSRPSHRLCVLQSDDRPTLVIAADHAHVDMWSLLVVVRDLLRALDDPAAVAAEPVRPFADHTAALRGRPPAPDEVRKRWHDIIAASGDVMPTFPMPLGDVALPVLERVELREVLDVDQNAFLARHAAEQGVSALALVVSVMTDVTWRLARAPLRAVFPVHSRYEEAWHDSVGWFITNSVLESDDASPKASAAAVKEAVRLGSWPLEDVLEPWGDMPEAPGMFAISWLDLRRLPVRVDHVGLEAQYVSAAGRADGVMVWFILDESGLHLRCRYPDTDEARRSVGGWLDALVREVRALAGRTGTVLQLDDQQLRVGLARRSDVRAIVTMLASDAIGVRRESADVADYDEAFDALDRDPAQFLAVVRDESDVIVATAQLTIIPGLSRTGATRLQVEGVRVAEEWRGRGLGTAFLVWVHEYGRTRGAVLSQLTTDTSRIEAHRFYARLGYEPTHIGFKRPL